MAKTKKKTRNTPEKTIATTAAVAAQPPIVDPIKHVIVLMLENRSFDHMVGSLSSFYEDLVGIDKANPKTNTSGGKLYTQTPNALFRPPNGVDPMHELGDVRDQISNGCGGFIDNFLNHYPTKEKFAPQVMAYFDRQGQNRLSALHTLAENFTICDHWFSSVPGPTWPNRLFIHSGTSIGRVKMPNLHNYNQVTLYDRLNEQKVSWQIYFDDFAQSWLLTRLRARRNAKNYSLMSKFFKDVRGPEAKFPQYVFIEPCYFGGYESDQHPPADVVPGEELLARVYNAIRANDALWNSTLFVVLYDEHGGFYDQLVPPPATPPDDYNEEYDFKQYGLRVPALLVSPFASAQVANDLFDHTSLLRYVTDKWNLGPLGARVAAAKSFAKYLTSPVRTNTPLSISPPVRGQRATLAEIPPINDLQQGLADFSLVLESELKEAAKIKAQRLSRMVESPQAYMAAAKERYRRFLEQQKGR